MNARNDQLSDTLSSLALALCEIADRANLLREILRAGELGGSEEIADKLQELMPGFAMVADDISRAADAAGELVSDIERQLPPRRKTAARLAAVSPRPARGRRPAPRLVSPDTSSEGSAS